MPRKIYDSMELVKIASEIVEREIDAIPMQFW